jgi:hypothetical protein
MVCTGRFVHRSKITIRLFVASVVDRVGKSALQALGDSLLDALGDNRCVTAVLGVGLTAGAGALVGGACVVDLFIYYQHMVCE